VVPEIDHDREEVAAMPVSVTSEAVANVLNRLRGVRPKVNGEGWEALCPAHDDNRRSLGVAQGKDGRVLLKCLAGCQLEAIVEAVGLTTQDLFELDPLRPAPRPRLAAAYDYTDEAGTLLYQVCRFQPKDFRQRRPDGQGGWLWNLQGVRRVLYRLPELLAAPLDQTAWLVEGEKDVERLREEGLLATTNAGGAGKWRADYDEALWGRPVVILPDNDGPGLEHARQVEQTLTGKASSVRVLHLPGLPAKGDVSWWLDNGHTASELQGLLAAPQPEANGHAGSSHPEVVGIRPADNGKTEALLRPMRSINRRAIDWLWPLWLPRGLVSILDGDPGLGKSTLTLDLAARVSRGWRMPPGGGEGGGPAGVLLLSAEDDDECTIRPRLDAHDADPDRVHLLTAVRQGGVERPPCLPYDLDLVEQQVKDLGIVLVVIDPLLAYLDDQFDAHKDQSVRRALHHIAARCAWVVGRDPNDPKTHVLAMNKSNIGPLPPSLAYRLAPTGDVARAEWIGETNLMPEDILWHAQGKGRPPAETLEAMEFLRGCLAHGGKPAATVLAEAEDAGIAEKTLRRAKAELLILSNKASIAGGWLWSLPGT
jgi:putative DNA primase/helicase